MRERMRAKPASKKTSTPICLFCETHTTKVRASDGFVMPCSSCKGIEQRIAQYGLSLRQYWDMRNRQEDRCAICDEPSDKLFVDHCHTLGHVRGLLCRRCNSGLGFFKDKKGALANALKYLSFNDVGKEWCVQRDLYRTRKEKEVVLNKYVIPF